MRKRSTAPLFVALALFSLAGSGCASAPRTAETARPAAEERIPIIDAHTHTLFTGAPEPVSKIPVTREQYLREWQEAGVVGAVSHFNRQGGKTEVVPDRNIAYCAGIDVKVDAKAVEAGLKSGRYGCIKIYLGYVHRYAADPAYQPLYRLAEKYDVPVVFHTGDTYDTKGKLKYADPLTVDEVAVDHPGVRFVLAHAGYPWIQSGAEVAYKNPNVYLDGSAFLIGDLDRVPPEKVDEYVVKPLAWVFGYVEDPSKLMFGSDWPLTRISSYASAFRRAIPREHWGAPSSTTTP